MATPNRRLELISRRFWHRWVTGASIGIVLIILGCYGIAHHDQKLPIQPNLRHRNIITTEFWVGEPADSDNGSISNTQSVWDQNWQQHFGGIDSPNQQNFQPKENPFYAALPYSDIDNQGNRKTNAKFCLQVNGNQPTSHSWCKNTWIAITYQSKTAYAQWEDAGPFGEADVNYVFGAAAPANKQLEKAGLDVSPKVETYLGLNGLNKTDWQFVKAAQVPNGPWKQRVTADLGEAVN